MVNVVRSSHRLWGQRSECKVRSGQKLLYTYSKFTFFVFLALVERSVVSEPLNLVGLVVPAHTSYTSHTTHTPTHSIILSGTCFPLSCGCSSGMACTERTCRSSHKGQGLNTQRTTTPTHVHPHTHSTHPHTHAHTHTHTHNGYAFHWSFEYRCPEE